MYPSNLTAKDKYLSIGTFRKNGELKRTPVWFTVLNDEVHILTNRDSWKVKRIKNNPEVVFASCNSRGTNLGDDLAGNAKIVEKEASPDILKSFKRKYGFMFRVFAFTGRRSDQVFLSISQ